MKVRVGDGNWISAEQMIRREKDRFMERCENMESELKWELAERLGLDEDAVGAIWDNTES